MSDQTPLRVNMNPETTAALREMCQAKGIGPTEAVRLAIGLHKFFRDEQALGRKIQTMRQDGADPYDVEML